MRIRAVLKILIAERGGKRERLKLKLFSHTSTGVILQLCYELGANNNYIYKEARGARDNTLLVFLIGGVMLQCNFHIMFQLG